MKRLQLYIANVLLFMLFSICTYGQTMERNVQNRPYTDLRPMHFGIVVGMNFQDMKFQNIEIYYYQLMIILFMNLIEENVINIVHILIKMDN